MTTSLDHDYLVERAVRWLRNTRRCSVVFAEISTAAGVIPDAIGFSHLWSIMVECKVSRSDFFADKSKKYRRNPSDGPGQERWMLTPPHLVTPDETPEGWGLAEVWGRQIKKVRLPPPERRRGMNWNTDRGVVDEGRSRFDTLILLSAVRRHQLGVEWCGAYARFEASSAEPRHRMRSSERRQLAIWSQD